MSLILLEPIERQICELTGTVSIREWEWFGSPLSELSRSNQELQLCHRYFTSSVPTPGLSWSTRSWYDVDLAILKSSTHECSRSESEYVRECKKWLLALSLEDTLTFIMKDIFTLESYPWQGRPTSADMTEEVLYGHFRDMSMHLYMENDQSYTNEQNRQFAKRNYACMVLVDEIIFRANENVALTSPILYIRECKKWFIDNYNDFLGHVVY